MGPEQNMLRVDDIGFWYQTDEAPVVLGLQLTVQPNDFVAVVGESGCGKTTLLRLMSGLIQLERAERPEIAYGMSGSVSYENVAVTRPVPAFAYVPQNFDAALAPWLSARRNVLLAARRGTPGSAGGHADTLLQLAGIGDVAHLNVRRLSGGQKQRVALCRSLLSLPRLLFMDEPFANLDSGLKPEMAQLLKTVRSESGLAVVLVTHDIEGALDLADRVLALRRGYGKPEHREWPSNAVSRHDVESWIAGAA